MASFSSQLQSYLGDFPEEVARLLPTFVRHFELLNKWNEASGLVSPKSLEWAASKHYYDSLKIALFCSRHAGNLPIVDLGSGGGFPGTITAIVHPGLVCAYERIQKKRAFIDICVGELRLTNLSTQGELLKPLANPVLLSARAVSPPEKLFPFLRKVLAPNSKVVVPTADVLAPVDGFKIIKLEEYILPLEGEARKVSLLENVPRGTVKKEP